MSKRPYAEIAIRKVESIEITPGQSGWCVSFNGSPIISKEIHYFNKWFEVIGFLKQVHQPMSRVADLWVADDGRSAKEYLSANESEGSNGS